MVDRGGEFDGRTNHDPFRITTADDTTTTAVVAADA